MCHTTNKPWVYSPTFRLSQAGRSEWRAFHKRLRRGSHKWCEAQRQRSTVGLLHTLSLCLQRSEGLLWALISLRGVEQLNVAPETPCFIRRKKQDFRLWCHHWGLLQQSDPQRELSWESWSSPYDIWDYKGWDEVVASQRTCRLASSYLVFSPGGSGSQLETIRSATPVSRGNSLGM